MCGRLDIRISEDDALYLRARDLRLDRGTPTPMHAIPLLTTSGMQAGIWGFPVRNRGPHIHARQEEGRTIWASAWYARRAVIPVVGWWEGSWHVTAENLYLAVLTSRYADGLRAVVVTQPGGVWADRIERFPVPLTANGAADWLGGADDCEPQSHLTVVNERVQGPRHDTWFDSPQVAKQAPEPRNASPTSQGNSYV